MYGLVLLLLSYYFVQPVPLFADSPLVTQEFRYHLPEASEVYLVWGVSGWAIVPEEVRPAGTFVENNVMHTPMAQGENLFVATIQVPAGTKVDYGFQTRKLRSGSLTSWAWDGDYQLVPSENGVTEVEGRLALKNDQVPANVSGSSLPLLIGLSLIFVIGAVFLIRREATFIRGPKALLDWGKVIYLRDLLRELVVREMKLRYKRSFLGLAWSLINPLVQLLVLYLIFSLVLQLNIQNYPVFLFTGLLVWTWFQSSLVSATSVILENPDLIKRPGFPVAVLPVVTVTTHLIHFLLALPILLIFLFFSSIQLSSVVLTLPFIIVLQFLFTLSLAYLVAAIHVTFRDTQYLLGIFLLLGFYLSPIFYEKSLIPERFQMVYRLNPMVDLIDAYRTILIQGELPGYLPLFVLGGVSLVFLWLGYRTFIRTSYRFIEEL